MSENLKRLRRDYKKAVEHERKAFAPYRTLAGMSQIEDLERKIEETSKEEERIKEQIQLVEEEKKHLLQNEIKIMRAKADEEDKAYHEYMSAANYSAFPTIEKIFKEIANDELNHSRRLKLLADELEREIL